MGNEYFKNNLKAGFFIALTLLKNRGEVSFNQIMSIPFLNKKESELIYARLVLSPNVLVRKKKTSSEPYLRFEKIIELKNISQ